MLGDDIASCVLDKFDALPAKRKPIQRADGVKEWVPLSGIVLEKDGELTCVALATGLKCLPASRVADAKGIVVHDQHAEVLAIRAFNRFLIQECLSSARSEGRDSPYIVRSPPERFDSAPWALRDDVKIYMYCSEAPCGDASMELIMRAQNDSTPWEVPEPVPTADCADTLLGRGYFSRLGIVRRKPARPDAPISFSKSCSDKLALKQCMSLLNHATSRLVCPKNAYINTLVLPASQHVEDATQRAFAASGRFAVLKPELSADWSPEYKFRPFSIETTELEFRWSKRQACSSILQPSNSTTVWTPYFEESLIGGVLRGRRLFDLKGASAVCRRSMWTAALKAANALELDSVASTLKARSYASLKQSHASLARMQVKRDVIRCVLQGWQPNTRDDDFQPDLDNV